jgi:hypothetical protein
MTPAEATESHAPQSEAGLDEAYFADAGDAENSEDCDEFLH